MKSGVVASLVGLVLGLAAAQLDFAQALGLKVLDWQMRLLAEPERAGRDIVLIEVDQASLDHFEEEGISWPWPRTLYAPIVSYLSAAGAKAVLFDILFNNLSPYGIAEDRRYHKARDC